MPMLTQSNPKYRKHRASGQAIVTLNGTDHYLGPHGTKSSEAEYDRLIAAVSFTYCSWYAMRKVNRRISVRRLQVDRDALSDYDPIHTQGGSHG